MNALTNAVLLLVRVSGLIQVILGVLFWTGNALSLIPVHILNGFLIVLLLWLLAGLAVRAGVAARPIALAVAWSLIMPALGLYQAQLLPGDFHWVIEVLHLLVGIAAIGMADNLVKRIKQLRAPVFQS